MPKPRQKPTTRIQFLAKFDYFQRISGKSDAELSAKMRISEKTFKGRIDNPNTFKAVELEVLAKAFSTTVDKLDYYGW
ncbi:MAG: hypothetical protein VB018_09545 [Lachnospiraceae bacterium]|nr:hypothetical protein [Lachnospiraceae bacterium]